MKDSDPNQHLRLYSFWRSSAAFRVRIALNIKQLSYESVPVNLSAAVLAQKSASYRAINPQGLVPALVDQGRVLAESLAIIEYLEEVQPEPKLLPSDSYARAQVRWMAQLIACDIHPLNNTRVLGYLRNKLNQDETSIDDWYRHWILEGFAALEILANQWSGDGSRLFGNQLTIADICLVPQVYNARRFKTPMHDFPVLNRICSSLETLPAFAAARPELQPDAVS